MKKLSLKTAEDVLKLPEGNLTADVFGGAFAQVSFSRESVIQCAELIISKEDETEFTTQAAVCAHAGNRYGWGVYNEYRSSGGNTNSNETEKDEPEKVTSVILKKPEDALKLDRGGLVGQMLPGVNAQCSFSTENVIECAKLLISKKDKTKFYTQAGVIVRAGNQYGWGMGGGYATC